MSRAPSRKLRRSLAAAVALLLWAAPALAHGPTCAVSSTTVRPARLVVEVGDTVHFRNANSSGTPVTLLFEEAPAAARPSADEPLRSPTMGRAGDWHYTFEVAGEYRFVVEGLSARGAVTVVPASD